MVEAKSAHSEHRWCGNLVTATMGCGQERFLPFGNGLSASSCVGESHAVRRGNPVSASSCCERLRVGSWGCSACSVWATASISASVGPRLVCGASSQPARAAISAAFGTLVTSQAKALGRCLRTRSRPRRSRIQFSAQARSSGSRVSGVMVVEVLCHGAKAEHAGFVFVWRTRSGSACVLQTHDALLRSVVWYERIRIPCRGILILSSASV